MCLSYDYMLCRYSATVYIWGNTISDGTIYFVLELVKQRLLGKLLALGHIRISNLTGANKKGCRVICRCITIRIVCELLDLCRVQCKLICIATRRKCIV